MTLTRRKFIQISGAERRRGARLRAHHALVGARRGPRRGSTDRGRPRRRLVLRALLLGLRGEGAREGRAGHEGVGNADHPLLRAAAVAAPPTGFLYDPDRLKRPLVRTQRRGEDVFEEVSWDAALNRVGEGLLEAAPGHRRRWRSSHGSGGSWFKHFMKAWGSPNVGAPRTRSAAGRGRRATSSPSARRRVARADRSRERAGDHAHRQPPRREHAQHPGAGARCAAAAVSWSTRASRWRRARRATGCRSSPAPTSRSSPG